MLLIFFILLISGGTTPSIEGSVCVPVNKDAQHFVLEIFLSVLDLGQRATNLVKIPWEPTDKEVENLKKSALSRLQGAKFYSSYTLLFLISAGKILLMSNFVHNISCKSLDFVFVL